MLKYSFLQKIWQRAALACLQPKYIVTEEGWPHVSDWFPPAMTKCSKNRMWKINFTVKPKRPKVCFDCVPIVKEAGSLVAHRPGTGRCLRIQVEFFLVPNYGN